MLRTANRAWHKAVPYILGRFFASSVYRKFRPKMLTKWIRPDSINARFYIEKLVPLLSPSSISAAAPPPYFQWLLLQIAKVFVLWFFSEGPFPSGALDPGSVPAWSILPCGAVTAALSHKSPVLGGAKQQFGLYWCLLSSMLTLNNDVATVLMLHARPNEWERNIFIILKCQIDFTSSWHYLYILLSPPPPSFFFFLNTALISQAVIVSAAPSQARAFEWKKKTNMLWVFSYIDIISCPSLSQWMC